ncbi:ATP-dependent DNA helicase RecG [Engelhardtia mirabilis]|uniref:ATP-dependent DNA helicase RecG n=1 Tax=Engelhardtia mirabilis TaxID=2528011 RepID=A0A518BN88_9BACT|nr:ATP-dependent DNA helicase RecG [Planctomycetes bacterium Pla133]QDV02774.1 ATP-dependent DNA helicase RecG [Planctomycetes bacterium Pla86]
MTRSPKDASGARRAGAAGGESPAAAQPGPRDRVDRLHGVGPARAAALGRAGVRCIADLACLNPRQLEEVGPLVELARLGDYLGARVFVRGEVLSARFVRSGRGRSMLRVRLSDESGAADAVFFNQPWMRDALPVGEVVDLYGSAVDIKGPALASPRRAAPGEDGLVPGALLPIYPNVEGIGLGVLRDLVQRAHQIARDSFVEALSDAARADLELPSLPEALDALHAPRSRASFERARRRLALEPVLALQARLQERLAGRIKGRALQVELDDDEHRALIARLPFEPTGGQRRIMDELRRDLARRAPMRRLLQGDVGSGKTSLGIYACSAVAARAAQAAFMAPTELLAEQHFAGQWPLLAREGLRAELLTGSQPAAQRRATLARLASGEIDVLFGTHALFSRDVRFASLALAVVDEQHRFGVSQRRELFEKGRDVHVLLMTATPIPRTLALTLYGDLEVSSLRERPPGRLPLRTHRVKMADVPRLLRFLDRRLAQGERVFWVAPRIEAGAGGRGAIDAHAWLSCSPLARHGIELVHGRLPSLERTARLDRFRRGDVGLLVGTTVLEVGVDVPQATAMVIEGAERFGLAQLHQLRGRVGRGTRGGTCFLFGADSAAERLELLERTEDGFALAEEDLAQRGMGDLAGLRQAGDNAEGLRSPDLDLELILRARDLMAQDAELRAHYMVRPVG